jgi:superfamily II DNA/RNA helicase
MERVNIATVTIHSDKDQKERAEAMRLFRSGEVKILVATDVSARGIDIPDVDYVVNYDLPDKPENYVHRVGRTGRGMKKGLAVSFSSPEEHGDARHDRGVSRSAHQPRAHGQERLYADHRLQQRARLAHTHSQGRGISIQAEKEEGQEVAALLHFSRYGRYSLMFRPNC